MARDEERDDASQISTDRETIRTWADEHGATPYRHRDEERFRVVTGDDAGGSHDQAGWDEFFSHLEEGDRVVIYHGQEADEPFEVTQREEVFTRSDVDREELEERLLGGETVTSTVTETTVVEEVIVEEATIESELVDTAIVDDSVVDVELIRRECTECTLEDTGDVSDEDWFDVERYVTTVGRPETAHRTGTTEGDATETGTSEPTGTEATMRDVDEFPFSAVLEVDEAWSVTRELTERFTVESRVADVDVSESDSIEARDVDVEGLQRSIVESDVIELDRSPDEIMTESEIETEFSEDDAIHTHFTRTRVVEDEIVDRQRLRAAVTDAELLEFERIETRDVGTEAGEAGTATSQAADESEAATGETEPVSGETGAVQLSDDEIGKDVVDASGEEIGMVTEVADDGTTMYVDAHPGIADRIRAALDWGGADDDDYPVDVQQIDAVTRDEVQLKAAEDIEEISQAQ